MQSFEGLTIFWDSINTLKEAVTEIVKHVLQNCLEHHLNSLPDPLRVLWCHVSSP